MCHYITLIAPTEDADAVRAVMARHGRDARPIDNPSVRTVLAEGERQYLTTRGHCDCGTVLSSRGGGEDEVEARLARQEAAMRRKGWSPAKIARALDDQRRARARPDGGGADSLELWNAALRDLGVSLGLGYAGLLVRFYDGSIADETFAASRREAPRQAPWNEALAAIAPDTVTLFRLG